MATFTEATISHTSLAPGPPHTNSFWNTSPDGQSPNHLMPQASPFRTWLAAIAALWLRTRKDTQGTNQQRPRLAAPRPLLLGGHHDPVCSCVGCDRPFPNLPVTFQDFYHIQPGLATGELRLLMCTTTADFVWVVGIRTQGLTRAQQAPHPQSQPPAPQETSLPLAPGFSFSSGPTVSTVCEPRGGTERLFGLTSLLPGQ